MADQALRPIHEELLSIVGIAGAEFDGDPTTPEGVRVQLAPGADPEHVGREVRRVLAGHGMRSQLTAPAVAPKSPPPPPEPRTVVNLADFDQFTPETDEVEDPAAEVEDPAAEVEEPEASAIEKPEPDAGPPVDDTKEAAAVSLAALEHVGVSQHDERLSVSVTIGAQTAERRAIANDAGVDRALLSAVCELLGIDPEPALVSVSAAESDGSPLVTVLLDDGASRTAGSAVIRGNRAWAVARAMWAALSGPA